MSLRREMHDRARLVMLEQFTQEITIANVALFKPVSRVIGDGQEVARIARVSEFVEINYLLSFLLHPLQDEVGADKSAPARNKNRILHGSASAELLEIGPGSTNCK
jgi:hypothetical protein